MARILTALLSALLLWGSNALASTIDSVPGADHHALATRSMVLADPTKAMTVEQVAAAPEESFKPIGAEALGLGYTTAAHWVRIKLRSEFDAPTQWLLEAGYALIHDVTFYVPLEAGGFIKHQMGLAYPYATRVVDSPNFAVPVELPAKAERTYYVRIVGDYSLAIPFTLYSQPGYAQEVSRRDTWAGVYYGIVLIMILYNLLLYFSLRDRNYLSYVGTLLFLHLLYQLTFLGQFYQYVGNAPWFASRALVIFVPIGIAFAYHFCRTFMHTAEVLPRLDKVLKWIAILTAGVQAPLAFVLPISVSDNLSVLGAAAAAIMVIVTSAMAWKRGYGPARFFLFAWSSMLVADVLYTLKIAHVLPANIFTTNALQMGSAVEVFLLSLALGDRINLLRKEKLLAQQSALEKQQEAADAQKKLVEHLQRMDKLKDEILANTSHELRTPLNGITGLAESMLDGIAGPLPAVANKNLTMIVGAARRLGSLVNDILDFSKMKQDKLALSVEALDLHEVAEAVLALSSGLVGKKALKLVNGVPQGLPPVAADANRLQQILHNLLGNAIKFTSQGTVEIRARMEAGRIEVQVIDSGIGIATENHGRIFEAFEQGDGSTAREYGGTGLGLAVTRKLVELHGGKIGLNSVVGKGSTFFFTLPVADGKPARSIKPPVDGLSRVKADDLAEVPLAVAAPAVAASGLAVAAIVPAVSLAAVPPTPSSPRNELVGQRDASVGECRILVVDDEPINQAVLANILTLEKHTIHQALNGADALEALEKNGPFDLVLLDIMMPRMSGYEVCKKIREQHAIAQLPVLMLTAKTQVTDLVEGFNAGANDYVTKPFSKRELLSRLRTHLQLSKMSAAAGRFVPYEFLSYLKKQSLVEVSLGDQVRQEMSVLFSDIRSYTSMSETMSPEENFKFLNGYFGAMAPVIGAHRGFIDKFIGDAIMALFDRAPADAVAAAVEMQIKLREFNGPRVQSGLPPVACGVGINTGHLMLGTIGHSGRMQSTVISDAVNVAARLEALTKVFKASIIVSSETHRLSSGVSQFRSRCLGRVKVKGKSQAIAIYEVYDGYAQDVIDLRLKTQDDFEKGIEAWQADDPAKCEQLMRRVLEKNPLDQPAQLYILRCDAARRRPSSDDQALGMEMSLLA